MRKENKRMLTLELFDKSLKVAIIHLLQDQLYSLKINEKKENFRKNDMHSKNYKTSKNINIKNKIRSHWTGLVVD